MTLLKLSQTAKLEKDRLYLDVELLYRARPFHADAITLYLSLSVSMKALRANENVC